MPDKGTCSTVIVGKAVSETGFVIMGHNEDDYDCTLQVHRVPRMKHEEGEVLTFADASAVIPQVAETYAYQWSEYRDPAGACFADCSVNEFGVAIMTDSCRPCKISETEPPEAGLGYALRRIIPERAKTAREGVEVAIELLEKYGYISSRTYQIADKDEAWILQVPTGKNYVARRVDDDEVYFMTNHFTIHEVDFTDTAHKKFYFSADLVDYTVRNGWYTPKTAGDYSDFDFAAAYQEGEDQLFNVSRVKTGWRKLFGEDAPCNRPFAKKVNRKFTVQEVKDVFGIHFEDAKTDPSEGYKYNPHGDRDPSSMCNAMTMETFVVEFDEAPALTCIWRAVPKACFGPFVPFYLGSVKSPKGYSWMNPVHAQHTHFYLSDEEQKYRPETAHWVFRTLLYLTEFDYKWTHDTIKKSAKALEKVWVDERPIVIDTYKALIKTSPKMAEEFLTSYTGTQAETALNWAKDMIVQLGETKIMENGTTGHSPKAEEYLP